MTRPRRQLSVSGALASLGIASIVGLVGCAQRQALDLQELARIHDSDPQLGALRAYVDRRLIVVHREAIGHGELSLAQGVVEERASSSALRQIIGRRSAGAIVAASEDERILWVSFDPDCTEVACAFMFVVDADHAFSLADAPSRAQRAAPEAYRGRRAKATLLVPSLRAPEEGGSLVLVRQRRRRPPVTVGLEVRKRTYRRDWSKTERARGFGP